MNWMVDNKFTQIKKKNNIPRDPENWTMAHVQIWLKWAMDQFDLRLQESDWRINGQQLFKLSLPIFQKMVRCDPGNKFWTHLELLRNCQFVAIPGGPNSANGDDDDDDDTVSTMNTREKAASVKKKPVKSNKAMSSSGNPPSHGNHSGYNGQIQLW